MSFVWEHTGARVTRMQLVTLGLFAVLVLLVPLKRPPDLPNPESPIVLLDVPPVPVRADLKTPSTFPLTTVQNSESAATQSAVLQLTAESIYVMDLASAAVLLEQQSEKKVSPASTTKLMSALVALEAYSLDEVLEVRAAASTDGARAGLFWGEQLTVEALVQATLIQSANDATMTLAENYPGGTPAFVVRMNELAAKLQLTNTTFTNPVGFDHPNHLSTARDLALLSKAALDNPFIARTVSQSELTIEDVSGRYEHRLQTTNELLKLDPTVRGIKTGTTAQAGQVLISLIEREGHAIIVVLLGSTDRFSDTRILADWVFSAYEWRKIEELRAEYLQRY